MTLPGTIARLSLSRRQGLVAQGVVAVATSMEIVSGQGQSATVSQAIAAPLVVRVLDQSGNPFAGRTVTATVNSGGGTITPSSRITDASGLASFNASVGSAAGFNSFTVTSAGLTGSPLVFTATALAASGLFPNEPAGFTLINERAYDTLTDGVWSNNQRITNGATIISDATAPKSPNNVVQLFYPEGTSIDGGEPWSSGYAFPVNSRYDRMYTSFWFKFSANWRSHASNVNKIYYWWTGSTDIDRARLFVMARGIGAPDDGLRLEIVRQGGPGGDQQLMPANLNTSSATIVRDQWHRCEILGQVNTPGSANGTVRAWLDGVEVINYSNVVLVGTGEILKFVGAEDTAVWGGNGGGVVIPAGGQFQWHDHIYHSGANV